MHQSMWLDACHRRPIARYVPRVLRIQQWSPDPNSQIFLGDTLSHDQTHQAPIKRTTLASSQHKPVCHQKSDQMCRSLQPPCVKSTPERFQSCPNMIGHVRCNSIGRSPMSIPSPRCMPPHHHTSSWPDSPPSRQVTSWTYVRSHSRQSLSGPPSFIIYWTHHPTSGQHEFSVRSLFLVTNNSTSPTSPPLLKCANHQVYHLVHMC
jgi:hypothetical protein